jgi:hypothetical protein
MDNATAEVTVSPEDDAVVRDTRVETLLESWSLPFELEQDFRLARLDFNDATQIRQEAHRAPKSIVDQYVTHMRHGAIFPPIVIGTNMMLVDGNTRVAACKTLNIKSFPAYKVRFPHLGMARLIGAALNQMGGDRLAEEEIVVAAEAMMAESYGDEAIARTLGRSVGHIRNVRRDRVFRDAVERTGLGTVKLSKQVQRVLAGIQHDEPFKAAVDVVRRANPALKDITQLVSQMDATRSDADAIAVVKRAEEQWGPVSGPPPAPRPLNRSRAKKALVHVRALLEFGENPAGLVVPDDDQAQKDWQHLNTLSTMVLALYPVRS